MQTDCKECGATNEIKLNNKFECLDANDGGKQKSLSLPDDMLSSDCHSIVILGFCWRCHGPVEHIIKGKRS